MLLQSTLILLLSAAYGSVNAQAAAPPLAATMPGAPDPQMVATSQDSIRGAISAKGIMKALSTVQESVMALDGSVKQVSATNMQALGAVATNADMLGKMLVSAKADVDKERDTDIGGSLAIERAAKGLQTSLDELSNDLIEIQPVVNMAGLNDAVLAQLKQQRSASIDLVDSVSEKIPVLARPLAKQQTAGITETLDKVIKAYSNAAAPPAPGASASPTAKASASAKASKAPKASRAPKASNAPKATGTNGQKAVQFSGATKGSLAPLGSVALMALAVVVI
ncbi:hypothetical protein BT63DRAFT_95228 [Microthyrium microscopicum]|uniref:Cell wall protein n=1 Tax=Microthyrium microscopicum TaxID=703497 RepID=A0A6A6TZ13_9PEZI|nr:hypothetical protein BT63DRAFT_95228 [Microthyrium microscopicum]